MELTFLNNYAVLPLDTTFGEKDGYTQINSSLGVDVFDEKVGSYHVFASAQKFRAEIALHANKNIEGTSDFTLPFQKMILFDGTISIYYNNLHNLPSSFLKGHPVLHGKIWNAYPESTLYEGTHGLSHLIITNKELSLERIGSIIQGYQYQQKQFEKEDKAFVKEIKNKLGFI